MGYFFIIILTPTSILSLLQKNVFHILLTYSWTIWWSLTQLTNSRYNSSSESFLDDDVGDDDDDVDGDETSPAAVADNASPNALMRNPNARMWAINTTM